ncbi:prolyl oligopeptidase family serine peptidase [Herbiconiux sp. CPCC 205716]|uniref:Acyl-peptide hydrolase n=1 Tax=Herbiconiux gentiana TaxID=2970912 RepID=A0ABT2GCY0_9MICO|nr:prolyl oligopeptidase family serine peptidase [Herbiconiux gentiana]MCS5714073.1 prolyl oligopeptidase family serine peptidase [Herbiconiux gentiana]
MRAAATAADGRPGGSGDASGLAAALVGAWGSWGPSMTPDAARVAFISDRGGAPEVWVQDVVLDGPRGPATRIRFTDDPVISVSWSADSAWLACAVATDGGVRTQVWVVRPDGSDARRISGSPERHVELGPWTRSGHRVVLTVPSTEVGEPTRAWLADPATGELDLLAVGELIHVLDLSTFERMLVLRDGQRGHEFCVVVDRETDTDHAVLPHPARGATDRAFIRPSPPGAAAPAVVYAATEVGLPRLQLVAAPVDPDDWSRPTRVLAARDDAELEGLDGDDEGRLLLLVWNVAGRSELELFDTHTETSVPVPGLPGAVATSPVLSRDGSSVLLAVEGPLRPRELWHLDTATLAWTRVSDVPALPAVPLVQPSLERFRSLDGLEITGWLYRAPGSGAEGPAMLHLHGGPESQERPTFSPQHQVMAAAGIIVFAPNVRGSSGFGREFVHADDVHRRQGAFDDVTAAAQHLIGIQAASAGRIAVTGRSYGGYLTLAALAFTPGVFAAGVDVCGMSHLLTFYAETEPWIAAAAVTKYGHPDHDKKFLRSISPLAKAERIDVPLLVVHGELDTNVPIGEAHRIVAALRELERPVEYLELAGEGHEYRRASSRLALIERMRGFLLRVL